MDKMYVIRECCASCRYEGEGWGYEWFCCIDGRNTDEENKIEPFYWCTKFKLRSDLRYAINDEIQSRIKW